MNFPLLFSALSAATAVMAGAFGAHGLKGKLPENLLAAFNTAAQYQLVHSVALLAIGVLILVKPDWRGLNAAAVVLMLGVLLFSGSLYALALTGVSKLGIITPFGGMALIIGWLLLALTVVRNS